MTLQTKSDACDGILFSLLACLMRDDIPASQLKTINSAWTAMNHAAMAKNDLTATFEDAVRTATAAKFSSNGRSRYLLPLSVPSVDASARVA